MNGWIKLHRKMSNWEWYQDSKTVHLFLHLLLNANHKDGTWKGIKVKRGQIITGRKKLSQETGISEQSVRNILKKLTSKPTSELTIKPTNKYSIITICNYDIFQTKGDSEQPANQPANQPSNQPQTRSKEDKKIRNTTLTTTTEKFLPPTVDEVKAYCDKRGNDIDAEQFVSFYESKDWMIGKNKMQRWKACVITWERNRNQKESKRPKKYCADCKHFHSCTGIGVKSSDIAKNCYKSY